MTKFEDGPAKGQVLMLKRAGLFLRVTEEKGKWDALDQPEDSPRPGEKLYAYKVFGEIGAAFVDGAKFHALVPIATYRFVQPQPPDEIMRNNLLWWQWCLAHE